MVGKDGFEADARQVDPAWVGGELEAEDVFLVCGDIHGVKVGFV